LGDFRKLEGVRVLITSLKNLLITPLGSYPFDPTFGSELYKKVFEPADSITAEEIKFEVIDRIMDWDDRVVINDVQTSFFSNQKGFRISVILEKGNSVFEAGMDFTEDEAGFALEEST